MLNAWAPAVTAFVAVMTGQRMELRDHCLSLAMDHARNDSSREKSPDHDKGLSCPFCFAHAGSFALPPVLHAPSVAEARPTIIAQAQSNRVAPTALWLEPQPRGPPKLS